MGADCRDSTFLEAGEDNLDADSISEVAGFINLEYS